jgi:hypothetical protein
MEDTLCFAMCVIVEEQIQGIKAIVLSNHKPISKEQMQGKKVMFFQIIS